MNNDVSYSPNFSQSFHSARSEWQILLGSVAWTHAGGVFEGVDCCLVSLLQALPALPSCAGCVSGGTWAARAYTQCPSCACPSHWRTSSFIGSSVTAFRLEKEEEQFVVYSKITIAKKKKSKASFTVFCGYQTLAMWQWKLKTPLHRQWMLLSTQCPHNLLSHQVTPAWEVLVCKQFTWHVCRCICTYSVIHTHTQRFPLHLGLYLFVQYLSSLCLSNFNVKIKAVDVFIPLVHENEAFSDEHQTYTIYCTSFISFDFASFHLLPVVHWSPINFQQSLAVQPQYIPEHNYPQC